MWAQAMVEYGILSAVGAGIDAVRYHVGAILADSTSRWILIAGAVLFVVWAFRRR